jgi:hypothetical protein
MSCETRARLLKLYSNRTREFVDQVWKTRREPKPEEQRLDGLVLEAEKARKAAEEAREELNRHCEEHGC